MADSLARARAIHEAATEGPWKVVAGRSVGRVNGPEQQQYINADKDEDARAIAFEHNIFKELLDVAEAANASVQRDRYFPFTELEHAVATLEVRIEEALE